MQKSIHYHLQIETKKGFAYPKVYAINKDCVDKLGYFEHVIFNVAENDSLTALDSNNNHYQIKPYYSLYDCVSKLNDYEHLTEKRIKVLND